MSDNPIDGRERLNLDELISRIERQQAETRKFVAEHGKLIAEDLRLQRDRSVLPWTSIATLLGAGAACFAAGAGFFKIFGGWSEEDESSLSARRGADDFGLKQRVPPFHPGPIVAGRLASGLVVADVAQWPFASRS